MSYALAAVESGEFNLDDTTSLDSTPFCLVFLNDNQQTSQYQEVKNTATFIRTTNRYFC